MVEDRWLSVDEIALYLGVKRDTMYKWIGRKQMPAQLGRSKRLIRITPMLMGVPHATPRPPRAAERRTSPHPMRQQPPSLALPMRITAYIWTGLSEHAEAYQGETHERSDR